MARGAPYILPAGRVPEHPTRPHTAPSTPSIPPPEASRAGRGLSSRVAPSAAPLHGGLVGVAVRPGSRSESEPPMGRSMGTPASLQSVSTSDLPTVPSAAVSSPPVTAGAGGAAPTPPPGASPAPPGEFKPRAARASLVHSVMCRYAGATDFIEVTTLNISQSGMLFRGETLPDVGTELEFKFVLENGFELLSGSAKVMRHASGPNGVTSAGVAFGLMDPPVQRILARVIEIHSENGPS